MTNYVEWNVIRDIELLHPSIRSRVENVLSTLKAHSSPILSRVRAFETYRHPQRQEYLLTARGTTRAAMYHSPHQFGLAVDFAMLTAGGKWSWNLGVKDWMELRQICLINGLDNPVFAWDPGHFEHHRWQEISRIMQALPDSVIEDRDTGPDNDH